MTIVDQQNRMRATLPDNFEYKLEHAGVVLNFILGTRACRMSPLRIDLSKELSFSCVRNRWGSRAGSRSLPKQKGADTASAPRWY